MRKVIIQKIIKNAKEIYEEDIKKLGNGAYISVPKKYIGKKATIVILN